ncbi:hypothetical protein [uncultured Tessaracoccus sp.]|uniref:hypothetical protein n=1 Tax=uncultured Tessaracoccus sp. TaxID=905023 RepID=UPI0025E53B21|nr:hypothetical protein [uncultured Tessaracoccus sp.]
MSRTLKAWAHDSKPRRGPRITLFEDLVTMWRPSNRKSRPIPRERRVGFGLGLDRLSPAAALARIWPRFEIEVVGGDALVGLETPFLMAVNEAGVMDQRVLSLALPRSLRPRYRHPSRALTRGRTVAIFSGEPRSGRLVGEFGDVAAQLAKQHSVAIVPVGLVGAFRLADTLQLPLTTRPKVSVRFGAPIHVRDRSIEEITLEVQDRVEHLVGEGELTWWEVERRTPGAVDPGTRDVARWRRLWDQAAPRPNPAHRRIWR